MNASNALTPSAQRTIQITRPTVVATTSPMCARDSIQRPALTPPRPARARRPERPRRLGRRAHEAVPTITPSAPAPPPRRAARASRCRTRARPGPRCAPWRARRCPQASARRRARPSCRPRRPCRESRARCAPIARRRSVGVVGATSGTSASPGVARLAHGVGLLERQVGHDQAARRPPPRGRREASAPRASTRFA